MLTKQKGNMYQWVTHMHSHLAGECSHKCKYCYVKTSTANRINGKYTGPVRLVEKELGVNYGKDKTIFIEHMNDLFARDVPHEWIERIITHCANYPDNSYVFQTKNPGRITDEITAMPKSAVIGCTIETNKITAEYSRAPSIEERVVAMIKLRTRFPVFVTIEPIMDFDPDVMHAYLKAIQPSFVNVGADSKRHNLPEPHKTKIKALLYVLECQSIEVREKHNLERLME